MSDVISMDGIQYVSAAQHLLKDDWEAAYGIYKWLFYPWLIAMTSTLCGLALEAAAQLLNALMSALLVVTFVSLISDFGGDRKTLLIAGLVILFHPYLGEARPEIIRDHGYWAFYLLSFLLFFRFYQRPRWQNAISWGIAMVVATLFRIEGMVFLILLPLALWFGSKVSLKERLKRFFKAYTVTLVVMLVVLVWVKLDANFSQKAGRLYEPIQSAKWYDLWGSLSVVLHQKAERLQQAMLTQYFDDYALPAVLVVLLLIMLDMLVTTLTPLYSILPFCRSFRNRVHLPAGTCSILVWLGLLNCLVPFVFLAHFSMLSHRHMVPLALTIIIIIPFILASVHDTWQGRHHHPPKRKWVFPLILGLLTYMTADSLLSSDNNSKMYLRESGMWLREHIPPGVRLFTNNRRISYYSGHAIAWNKPPKWRITDNLFQEKFWQGYHYLALSMDQNSTHTRQQLTEIFGPPSQVFENSKKDAVLIFRNI